MKRWPGIRHIRFWWKQHRFYSWGNNIGIMPSAAAMAYLSNIWEGRA